MSTATVTPDVETPAKARKTPIALTPEQKQAATKRRNASLLESMGHAGDAAKLRAEADALAPERAKPNKRVDPLTVLNQEEQKWLIQYFGCTTKGFAKIAAIVSAKKLEDIFQAQGN